MRAFAVISMLISLTASSSAAVPFEAVAGGTITRLDAETCRVEVTFTWVGEGPIFPTSTCNYEYLAYPFTGGAYTVLSGPFGTPEQMSPEPVAYDDGYAFWIDIHVDRVAFNFKPASTQAEIVISYTAHEDWNLEIGYCDQPDPCPQPCSGGSFAGRYPVELGEGSGVVSAELPQGIGDSTTLREIPVAVTSRTWSQVKSVFRE